jgi:hypothetical protein
MEVKPGSMGNLAWIIEAAIAQVEGKSQQIITEPNITGTSGSQGAIPFNLNLFARLIRALRKVFYWRMVPQRRSVAKKDADGYLGL